MNTTPHQEALHSRWTLEGTIPLSQVAEGAQWYRARSVASGDAVALFVVEGEIALETADTVRRAYLVEDPHLIPVRDMVVLGEGHAVPDDGVQLEAPMTVVEYPFPSAPPLAALLGKGALHPETARSIIGEAAQGLEVARRRGLRHQLLDSNRLFVDTASGAVSVLGVGVEAASHAELDRSREVASFQDTSALVALLYRALTGRSPRRGDDSRVPRPSTLAQGPIPQDLDLLCDLVLNESAEDIPETTRGLIAALEPWQSIPVTLEAYAGRGAVATPEEAIAGTQAPAGTDTGPEEPELESTRAMEPVPATGEAPPADASEQPTADPAPEQVQAEDSAEDSAKEQAEDEDRTAALALGAGAAGAATASAVSSVEAGNDGAEDAPTADPGPQDPAPADPDPQDPAAAREAKQLVEDLHLDRKRTAGAFPGHLDIEPAPAPQPVPEDAAAGPGAATDAEAGQDPSTATPADAPEGAARGTAGQDPEKPEQDASEQIPAATAGSHWPLAPAAGAAAASTAGAEATIPASATPDTAAGDAPGAGTAEDGGPAADAAAPTAPAEETAVEITPVASVHHGSGTGGTGPVAVAGRQESMLPATAPPPEEERPIVVRGREHASTDQAPAGAAAQPASRSALLRDVVGVAVDADDPETFAMGPEQPAERSRQSQWILLGGALLVILAMVFALSSITSGLRDRVSNPLNTTPGSAAATSEEATAEESAEETTEEEPELPAASLAGVEIITEDGEDADHPEEVDLITDGDTDTYWSTQIYSTPEWGGLMDGMGLRLELEEESTVSTVVVTTARNSGGTIELHTVNDDGSLGDTIAEGEFAGDGEVTFELDEPVDASELALWFPSLPTDTSDSSGYRGRVAEIRVE